MRLSVYVNYRGTCEAAFQFYEQHLGGRITSPEHHESWMLLPNVRRPADPAMTRVPMARVGVTGAARRTIPALTVAVVFAAVTARVVAFAAADRQPRANAGAPAQTPEPVVGLPCEGCEAVFQGLPATLTSTARIAPADEAGEPLVLTGRVLAADRSPRAGVVVYAYHTNAGGLYPRPARHSGQAGDRHGALRGWAVSGPDGRYTFETVRPGPYPTREAPAHIHMHVIERGCATYYLDDVMFTDDPLLTPAARQQLSNGRGGPGIVTPVKQGRAWHVTRDIHLGAQIPGYPGCRPAGAR